MVSILSKSWLQDRYENPTEAQLYAEKALELLNELDIECGCVYSKCPEEHYFAWPIDGTSIPKGTMLPSYAPIEKVCRKCELSNVLHGILDPEDRAGDFV